MEYSSGNYFSDYISFCLPNKQHYYNDNYQVNLNAFKLIIFVSQIISLYTNGFCSPTRRIRNPVLKDMLRSPSQSLALVINLRFLQNLPPLMTLSILNPTSYDPLESSSNLLLTQLKFTKLRMSLKVCPALVQT